MKLTELTDHIGDSIIVEGMVREAIYNVGMERAPTFLYIGEIHPKKVLTLIIWGADRSKFSIVPENAYRNRSIRVAGKLLKDHGKTEIVVYNPAQIVLIDKK